MHHDTDFKEALNQQGILLMDGFLLADTFDNLRAESLSFLDYAHEHRAEVDGANEQRGGTPAMSLRIGSNGPLLSAFYSHPSMLSMLTHITGMEIKPSSSRGCFNYYMQAGDHMSLHRDVEGCEVTVITCLVEDCVQAGSKGGMLRLYPERCHEPISSIRAKPEEGALTLRVQPSQTLVMYGGSIPHQLLPIEVGQRRIVSALCFSATPKQHTSPNRTSWGWETE